MFLMKYEIATNYYDYLADDSQREYGIAGELMNTFNSSPVSSKKKRSSR